MGYMKPDYCELIQAVDRLIEDAAASGLTETAALLRIVRFDLVTRANGIGEQEIDLLLSALEYGLSPAMFDSLADGEVGPKSPFKWGELVGRPGVRARRTLRSSRRYSKPRN